MIYRKFPKYSDTQNICFNPSKTLTMWLYHTVMSPNDADGMAKSVASRKLLRMKVTPDLHLTYSKNGGNVGLVLKMKNIACISILLTKHVKCTYLYLFKFVLYSIVDLKRINKINGHKTII